MRKVLAFKQRLAARESKSCKAYSISCYLKNACGLRFNEDTYNSLVKLIQDSNSQNQWLSFGAIHKSIMSEEAIKSCLDGLFALDKDASFCLHIVVTENNAKNITEGLGSSIFNHCVYVNYDARSTTFLVEDTAADKAIKISKGEFNNTVYRYLDRVIVEQLKNELGSREGSKEYHVNMQTFAPNQRLINEIINFQQTQTTVHKRPRLE